MDIGTVFDAIKFITYKPLDSGSDDSTKLNLFKEFL